MGLYETFLPGNEDGLLVYRINLDINRNNINTMYLYFETKRQSTRMTNENTEEYIFSHFSDSFRKYADT